LAEAGCTAHEIAAITGHASLKEVAPAVIAETPTYHLTFLTNQFGRPFTAWPREQRGRWPQIPCARCFAP
jgi:hypothetical protein